MKLADILITYSLLDQRIVTTKLNLLVAGPQRQVQINIWDECHLPGTSWHDLINHLLAAPAKGSNVEEAIRLWCRNNWTLKGPEVTVFSSVCHGRATTVRQLADTLQSSGLSGTTRAARRHVKSMLTQPLSWVRACWAARDLGRHLMWSTFDRSGQGPFDFKPSTAPPDYIRGALGLPYEDAGKPLLLLEYVIPPPILPRIPTIADAYAAGKLHYYFRPEPEPDDKNTALHGWTMPWDDPRAGPSRPEVVHAVISGACLVNVPREITK